MPKKEKVNYAAMTEDELNIRLVAAREQVFQLQFRNATAPLKNPQEITAARRDVARSLTFLKQLKMKGHMKTKAAA